MQESETYFNSVYDWYNLYRDIMSKSLLENPIHLGGMNLNGVVKENIMLGGELVILNGSSVSFNLVQEELFF